MKLKYRKIFTVLLAAVLIAAAGFAALYIKDKIDSRNPEYALPLVTVNAEGTDVPVTTAGFEWRFLFNGSIRREAPDIFETSFPPAELLGGEELEIEYSVKPLSVKVQRTDSYSYSFFETDSLTVPSGRGGYIYRLDIEYPRGSEICYFYIIVD